MRGVSWAALSGVAMLVALVAMRTEPRASQDGVRVAVLEFRNGGPASEYDSLGKGLQSMVTTDLAQVQALRLVERARLADIQAELKLGRSGQIDRKTAAQVGKLAGATHLLTGTFTLVGARMRIDSQLFAVESGDILLGEQIEGEKDAFFELEKTLVTKLIRTMGIELKPRERAEVGRLHTADFEAFRKFSQGLKLFDEKKFEASLLALREASRRDQDFKLAASTLAEYERLIAELRTRAAALEATQDEVRRLEQDKTEQVKANALKKLYAIAARKGQAAQIDRLVALHSLVRLYESSWPSDYDFFARSRTLDALWKAYFEEALKVFPRLPLIPTNLVVDFDPEDFDASFRRVKKWLVRPWPGEEKYDKERVFLDELHKYRGTRKARAYVDLWLQDLKVFSLASHLHLDCRGTAELMRSLDGLLEKAAVAPPSYAAEYLRASPTDKSARQLEIASQYRKCGMLAESNEILTRLAAGEKDARRLKEIADRLEENLDLQKSPKPKGARTWSSSHRVYHYMIFGDSTLWQVNGEESPLAYTQPSADPIRIDALDYYLEAREQQKGVQPTSDLPDDVVLVADGLPRQDVTARFALSYEPSADLVLPKERGPHRPEVGFAFGMRDVSEADRRHNWQLVFTGDALQLEEVVAGTRDSRGNHKQGSVTVKESQRAEPGAEKVLNFMITIEGDAVKVTLNGKTYTFRAPKERTGFYGLMFRGPGYALVRGFKTSVSQN